MTVEEAIVDVFERRSAGALFVTEVQYGIAPQRDPAEFSAALRVSSKLGRTIIVTKPAPDIHLADADLRIAARVAPDASEAAIEATWHGWLARVLRVASLLVSARSKLRIGVDIGGTFTDVTVMDPGDGSVSLRQSA